MSITKEFIFNINNGKFPSLGILQTTHTVDKDGNMLSSSNQRFLLMPLDNIPSLLADNKEVQDKMAEVFTQEVKAKYSEYLDSLKPSQEKLRRKEYEYKLAQINTNYVNSVNELSIDVSDTERSTWTKQEQEAKAYLAGIVDVPMLLSLAKARDMPIDYLASKIVEKASMYATMVGELTGLRQREEDALKLEYKDIL